LRVLLITHLTDAGMQVYLASTQNNLQGTVDLYFEGLSKISSKLIVKYPVPEK